MEKQKSWQLYLILAVIALTLFNILPTIFYYTKPLKTPIDAPRAEHVAIGLADRVNQMETDSMDWLKSFAQLLGVKPVSVELQKDNPRFITMQFKTDKDAALFRRFMPRAGSLIPFVPAQLELFNTQNTENGSQVVISRKVGTHFDAKDSKQFFTFTKKFDDKGEIAPFYRQLVEDRAIELAVAFGGPSKTASLLNLLSEKNKGENLDDITLTIATDIVEANKLLRVNPSLKERYLANLVQINNDKQDLLSKFQTRLDDLKTTLVAKQEKLESNQKSAKESNKTIDFKDAQSLTLLKGQIQTLDQATSILAKEAVKINSGKKALTDKTASELVKQSQKVYNIASKKQLVSLDGYNPFVKALLIDWANDKIVLQFYPEVEALRLSDGKTEEAVFLRDKINNLVINELARASRIADEDISPLDETFAINLTTLNDPQSFLALNLSAIAEKQGKELLNSLETIWQPATADLKRAVYPVNSYEAYSKLKPEDQKLGLVVYVPSKENHINGFKEGSFYVIAKGMDSILEKYKDMPESIEKEKLMSDVQQLSNYLQSNGFVGYSGASFGLPVEFKNDYIFELEDYYSTLVKATRENFYVKGSKQYALLDFSDVEQRILALNQIDDREQESLLKWNEEYHAAQVDIDATNRYLVPKPTKNPFWQNLKLSVAKYFRGDDRKVLKLGLDLSGGKTVRIGLKDQNGRPVTNPDDIKQASNELYTRINKMGVSERTIHVEGNNIVLDFPGSQNMSAAELVKASAMYFHIVNEKFSTGNTALREAVTQFLQGVWNEAVVTNRKDVDSVNEIAWQHLGGDATTGNLTGPRNEYAKILYENGLRLANPKQKEISNAYNDELSSIGIQRVEDVANLNLDAHPLLIVFHNYALEGSSLTNIQVGYDSSEGNLLGFSVKGSYEGSKSGNPREDFYVWTSQFAEDRIVGTLKESYSQGRGWRMAVILNGTIISSPSLRAPLKDSAQITGRFSQREVNQLAADLKAGSLSFTPKILSEENVSPELGAEERKSGVIAATVALSAVIVAMVSYYRFAGVIASLAVLFNILILWGVMQNIGQPLTLPGIAGIVLTIGMAVDANVLVFERIREEFKISGRIASAINAGYRKAFSAIIDSNITTIIAALILIQFDSGPVKGFAMTLIIGILSSMFTALFMTRYFFAKWVQNPKNKELSMSQFFGETKIDFLKYARVAVVSSLLLMAVGSFFFATQYKTMLGMDFTGGYSLNVELAEMGEGSNYRQKAADALLAKGATTNDFQIRTLSRPNQLRIQLATSMEEKGHPFYGLPEEYSEGKFALEYQKNPRIVWVVDALKTQGLNVAASQLEHLNDHWTAISGQFSDTMRNNALLGLGVALLAILIYITFRFEFNFAVAAVVGLAHDVVITLGLLAIFHALGFAVQLDLQVIGAIMTIIGYSLNDTIIVFDRVREDMHILRKMKFRDIMNHALNVTLSRTVMTSGTTLLVLLSLVFLGGQSIFAFSLVMTIGVLVGTFSSLFIACPVLLYLHNKEQKALQNGVNAH